MNFLKGKTDDDNTPCYIDFNNIIPMPEELLIEKAAVEIWVWNTLKQCSWSHSIFIGRWCFENHSMDRRIGGKGQKEALQLGASYLENRKKYGYPTWYEWSTATWGTKWNAYHQDFEEPNILWFDTAWNGVPLLIQNFPRYFRMWNSITPMRTKT